MLTGRPNSKLEAMEKQPTGKLQSEQEREIRLN